MLSRALGILGFLALLGTIPPLWFALRALGGREYVTATLSLLAVLLLGQMGLELLALYRKE